MIIDKNKHNLNNKSPKQKGVQIELQSRFAIFTILFQFLTSKANDSENKQ